MDGLVRLLACTGEVPVQVISRQAIGLSWGADLRCDAWSELPPEGRRWSFVHWPLGVAPDGPPHFSVDQAVGVLVAGGGVLTVPHELLTGVIGGGAGFPILSASEPGLVT